MDGIICLLCPIPFKPLVHWGQKNDEKLKQSWHEGGLKKVSIFHLHLYTFRAKAGTTFALLQEYHYCLLFVS
jgi:hypothetical protein